MGLLAAATDQALANTLLLQALLGRVYLVLANPTRFRALLAYRPALLANNRLLRAQVRRSTAPLANTLDSRTGRRFPTPPLGSAREMQALPCSEGSHRSNPSVGNTSLSWRLLLFIS